MSEIKTKEKLVGQLSAVTLNATANVPEWLQPLVKENGVYVGTEEPTDPTKLVWINPNGEASEGFYTISEINAMLEEYAKKDIVPTIYVKDASITDDILNIIKSDGTSLSFAGGSATSPTIQTEEVENGYKLIITDINGTKEVIISNGEQGPVGPQGIPGQDGQPGKDGISPTATVESNSDGAVITITDATGTTTAQIYNGSNGLPGQDGLDGQDGFSPTVELTDTETGVTLTITDVSGAKTATIKNGVAGPQGPQGEPGIQGPQGPAGKDGVNGQDGYTPVRGTDYWTENDKTEIVNSVLAALPAAEGVSV